MNILIKNGTLADGNKTDLYIKDGIISKMGQNLDLSADVVIDAKDKLVAPGLVDMHCHLRDPGQEYKEDIVTGTKSAVMGGFTSVACMPNTTPVADDKIVISYIVNKAKEKAYANVYPIGAISKGLNGQQLAEMGDMKEAGAVAVSDDGRPVENANLMKNALLYADGFGLPVISHCEDLNLKNDGSINEGYTSTYMGLRGISRASEEVMVSRECILAETYNVPVHIAHVSTKGSVETVRQAKKRGVKVTCETCPHYFTLTEEAVEGFNTNAKMNPPLRTKEDVEAIIEGLKDGTIDAIATDHAPHAIDEKNCEFDLALNGIVGLETAFGLSYTYLVKTGALTLPQLIEKMSINPSKILRINKGELKEGAVADVSLFDLENQYTVKTAEFMSKSKNSPYDGFQLYGKADTVIVKGEVKVEKGELK
ncbi:MAG: dihydroorotase [Clostridia bacterium]|nr:dihydroorotase [Clostridia bacterium]MBQ4542975.1 dihydroorotase [Clostridia bacterium]MBQ9997746.1 dihydroorotase [Clostridia bacterium]